LTLATWNRKCSDDKIEPKEENAEKFAELACSQTQGHEKLKVDLDPTPRAQQHDAWRFTPSLLDPNSFSFTAFANQPPGYYTRTPGGGDTLHHSQAGDLHTPRMGRGRGTPLSMPTSDGGVHGGPMMDFAPYPHLLSPQLFQSYGPFANPQPTQTQPQEQSYAPATFMHQDTSYETMDHDGSPIHDTSRIASLDVNTQHQSPTMSYQPRQFEMSAAPLPTYAKKFRFHAVLNAPTAMIEHVDEIPVTYLNKGHVYSVSVIDTAPMLPVPIGTQYRTFVRISFEEEQQRQRPATCWQLWKEGRGANEAHQRGGKLKAVEYVEASRPADEDEKRARVELDTASFDGFSVIWTPGVNGLMECNIAVLFNFLSTDFSHSKGVKGIPIRFCAKTEVLNIGSPHPVPGSSEVAYCKVKLFRDHGAERKLSNDVQHVKKTIDKLKQEIAQPETGMEDFSRRKRTGSISKPAASQRAGKVQKHKRTWSISSASSAGGARIPREDLHLKLQQQQDRFTSTRTASVLYLRGAERDDPDLYPVALPGEPRDLTKVDSREGGAWQQRTSRRSSTADTSSLMSPSSRSVSPQSQVMMSTSIPASSAQWTEYHNMLGSDVQGLNPQQLASPPDQVTKISKTDDAGSLRGWIEALEVDTGYRAPFERPIKPVACFYVLYRDPTSRDKQQYYRAVYLPQRTLKDLVTGIAAKWNIEPTRILRAIHVLPGGLEVEMDDDIVRKMLEGQDVDMEVSKIAAPKSPVKCEWEMAVDGEEDIINSATHDDVHTGGYEIRLIF